MSIDHALFHHSAFWVIPLLSIGVIAALRWNRQRLRVEIRKNAGALRKPPRQEESLMNAVAAAEVMAGQPQPDDFTVTHDQPLEEALHIREQQYQLLIENLHAGVVVHAPDTRITLANHQAAELLGLSMEQLLGKTAVDPIWTFFREDETPMPLDEYPVNRVLATRRPVRNLTLGIKRPGAGDWVWILINAFLEQDVEGNLRQIVVTFIDTTEQRKIQAQLRESEAHYRLLFEAANDGIVFHTIEPDLSLGRFISVNPVICRLLGYTGDEMLHMTPLDIQEEDELARVPKEAQNLFDQGSLLFEKTLTGKDGRRVPVEIHARTFVSGGQALALSIIRDVTERKRAEIALRASETRFRQLFASMTTGFALHEIIVNAQGQPEDYRFLEVNPAFEQVTGLNIATLIGKTVRQALPTIEPDWIEIYGQVALTGEPAHFEHYTEVLDKIFEVIAYCPQIGQFACLFSDITERKRLEVALREMTLTDDLTGLANRRHFMVCLDEELARLQRHATQRATVLMLDLDHFKAINDRFGHATGDAVLRHCALLMQDSLRKIDHAGRLGGEEFAILLSGADLVAAQSFAERLRQKFANTPIMQEGPLILVTVSIGVSALKAQDLSGDSALERADAALYQAKAEGRNRVVIATE